ncbi:hypothetical protein ACUN9Y_03495 [Halomonas sp. V046]|uniref:hypothetical protein n=1 Tax=Halomonas sp. V046 TaxID=3459611 RepID=UPI004043F761
MQNRADSAPGIAVSGALAVAFDGGERLAELGRRHGRTHDSIKARLTRLGRLEED